MPDTIVQRLPEGADASSLGLGMLIPVTNGLLAWFYPGGSAAQSIANRSGAAPATVQGTPSFFTGYARFTGLANFLQTTFGETASQTLLSVWRVPPAASWDGTNATKSVAIGNFSSNGSMLWTQGGSSPLAVTNLAYTSYWDGGSGTGAIRNVYGTGAAGADARVWSFQAGVAEVGVGRRAYDKTRGTSAVAPDTAARFPNTVTPYRIGSAAAIYGGQVDVAFAAIFNRALSEAEIDAVYATVKSYLARRGIAI